MRGAVKQLGRVAAVVVLLVNLLFTGLLLLSAYSPWVQPVRHPLFSCMGLAFPLFLLLDVAFLVFWVLVRRYRHSMLSLGGLLLCLPQVLLYAPVNFSSSKVPCGAIKLLSYNIMGFNGVKAPRKHNPILDYLKESHADIICLQEYAAGRVSQKNIDRALKDYPYHRSDYIGQGRGNRVACYSKFPILSARRLPCESQYNGSMVYEIALKTDTLTLICNHLESNKLTQADKAVYEDMLRDPGQDNMKSGARLLLGKLAEASAIRAPQADSVAAVIDRIAPRSTVVCGDFNDTPISYAHHTIGRRLDDAFAQSGHGLGISYNRNKFYFRIDHILVSPNLKTYCCTVDRSIDASDHYPIWCYIAGRNG